MTRLSRNSTLSERSFAPQRVLHSTSGNAHFSGTGSLTFSGQAESNSIAPPLYHPHPVNAHDLYVPFEVQDQRGRLHRGWKKTPSVGGFHQDVAEAERFLERQVIKDAQGQKHIMWTRINGMLTCSEMDSPKYIAYRARQQKSVNKNGEPVWSDELEEAFQFALRKIPPMGKKKTPSGEANEKHSCGRNELITKMIYKLTGVIRSRKQVSSHIQVLKALMNKGSLWLKFVTYDEKMNSENGPTYSYFDAVKGEMVYGPPKNLSRHSNLKTEDEVFSRILPLPINTLGSSSLPRNPSVQRIRFDMCVHAAVTGDIIHTYTTTQSEMGAQSRNLEDVLDWRSTYPDLGKRNHEHNQLNSELFLLETNFKLLDDLPPQGSRLGIHLFADVDSKQGYTNWKHSTTFYVHGEAKRRPSGQLRPIAVENTSRTQLEIPLESSWWIDVFHQIIVRRYKKIATGNAKGVLQEEEDARRYLRELSVMQEIYATSPHEPQPQRIAIFLWKFRQTRGDEAATTTWRRLVRPPPAISIHPPPPCKQPSLGIYQTQLATFDNMTGQSSNHVQRTHPLECGNWAQPKSNPFNGPSQDVTMKTDEDCGSHIEQHHLNALSTTSAFSENQGHYQPETFLEHNPIAPIASMTNREFAVSTENYPMSGSSAPNLNDNRSCSSRHEAEPYSQHSSHQQASSYRSNDPIDLSALDYSTEGFSTQGTALSYSTTEYPDGNFLSQGDMTKSASEFGQSTAHYTSTDMESHATSRSTPDSYGEDFTGGQIHLNIDTESNLALYDPAILSTGAELNSQHQHQPCIPHEHDPEYLRSLVPDGSLQREHQQLEHYLPDAAYPTQDQRHHPEQNPRHSLIPHPLDTYLPHEPNPNHHYDLPCDAHSQHPQHHNDLSPSYEAEVDSQWQTQLLPDPFADIPYVHGNFKSLNGAAPFAEDVLQTWDIVDLPAGIGECEAVGGREGGEQEGEGQGKILGEVGLDVEMGEGFWSGKGRGDGRF